MNHKVEITTQAEGYGSVKLDGMEVKNVTTYKVEHKVGFIPKVELSIIVDDETFIFDTAEVDINSVLIEYMSDLGISNLLKNVQAEANRRGIL